MNRCSYGFIVLAAALSLQGCTTPPVEQPATPSYVHTSIDSAIARVRNLPAHTVGAEVPIPPARLTGSKLSVTFQGEAADLLKKIAAARGKVFVQSGPKPHVALFVSVQASDVSHDDLLRDIASQFGMRADLVLTDSAYEIRYRSY